MEREITKESPVVTLHDMYSLRCISLLPLTGARYDSPRDLRGERADWDRQDLREEFYPDRREWDSRHDERRDYPPPPRDDRFLDRPDDRFRDRCVSLDIFLILKKYGHIHGIITRKICKHKEFIR